MNKQRPRQWVVTTYDGEAHMFEDECAALRFAHAGAWTDRPTYVQNPDGTEWLVMLTNYKRRIHLIISL